MKDLMHFRRHLAAVTAAALSLGAVSLLPAQTVTASGTEIAQIVVLGDSISAGYGLASGESGYYDYLAEMTGAKLTNLAVSGAATADLLAQLEQPAVQSAVQSADLICLSIGGNDLLQPAKAYFETLQLEGESMLDTVKRLASTGKADDYIATLTRILREPRNTARNTNIPAIAEKLRTLNADAEIVWQTIYNPLQISAEDLAKQSATVRNNYDDLKGYVQGQLALVNNAIKALEGCKYADVYTAFQDCSWHFIRTAQKDIHPNLAGHALIADLVSKAAGITAAPKRNAALGEALYGLRKEEYLAFPAEKMTQLKPYIQTPEIPFGDLDGNGKIELRDAMSALKYVSQIQSFQSGDLSYKQFLSADVSGSGDVELADATMILRYYQRNTVDWTVTSWYEITQNPDAPK